MKKTKKSKKPKYIMYNDLADKLSDIRFSQDTLTKLTLLKNVLDSKTTKEFTVEQPSYSDEWEITEMTVAYWPNRKVWNSEVVLHVYPRSGGLENSNFVLDIDDHHTLTNIDDIIRFLTDIHCDRLLEGIEVVEGTFKWE